MSLFAVLECHVLAQDGSYLIRSLQLAQLELEDEQTVSLIGQYLKASATHPFLILVPPPAVRVSVSALETRNPIFANALRPGLIHNEMQTEYFIGTPDV